MTERTIVKPPSAPLSVDVLRDIARGLAEARTLWAPLAVPGSGDDRRTHLLLRTESYDAYLLTWAPGQRVTPHDHGASAVAFVVADGAVDEVRYSPTEHRRRLHAGEGATAAPGVVHDVQAADGLTGASIHVYSPPLATMTFFSEDGRIPERVEAFDETPIFDDAAHARALHPAARRR